jgi:hypothetical protein
LLAADEFGDRLAAGFDLEEDIESLRELDEGDCLSQDILKIVSLILLILVPVKRVSGKT